MKKIMSLLLSACYFLTLSNPLHAQQPAGRQMMSASADKIDWSEDYTQARQIAAQSGKPVLLLFTGSNWCPACMKLEREVLKNPEFARLVKDRFVFVKLDFLDNSPEGMARSLNRPLIDQFNITAFPTIVVVNANGQRLFNVPYRAGGAQMYAQDLLQKLNQSAQSQGMSQR